MVAAAPWHSQEEQAEAAQREAPKPLPGFEALYNPFGSALPNARRHSKPGQAPDYKWVGALLQRVPGRDMPWDVDVL